MHEGGLIWQSDDTDTVDSCYCHMLLGTNTDVIKRVDCIFVSSKHLFNGTYPFTFLASLVIFHALLSSAHFFQNNFFKIFFQEHYQSVKWFGSRSGQTFY